MKVCGLAMGDDVLGSGRGKLGRPASRLGLGDVGFLEAQGEGIGEALHLALEHLLDGDHDNVVWRLAEVETRLRSLNGMLASYGVALDGVEVGNFDASERQRLEALQLLELELELSLSLRRESRPTLEQAANAPCPKCGSDDRTFSTFDHHRLWMLLRSCQNCRHRWSTDFQPQDAARRARWERS